MPFLSLIVVSGKCPRENAGAVKSTGNASQRIPPQQNTQKSAPAFHPFFSFARRFRIVRSANCFNQLEVEKLFQMQRIYTSFTTHLVRVIPSCKRRKREPFL